MTAVAPRRGEIWQVNFSPQQAAEIRTPHPAVVISTDDIGRLPLRIVVPITDAMGRQSWFVPLTPTPLNGLDKPCVADGFQCKSVSLDRFLYKRGTLSEEEFRQVVEAVLLCIGA